MRLSVVLVALVAACAGEPLSEDEVYRRQNAEILRAERYERFKRACQGSGGIVVVRRHGSPRLENDVPRPGEYACAGGRRF